jgi:quercetin dioxygenase-like cupin family protein
MAAGMVRRKDLLSVLLNTDRTIERVEVKRVYLEPGQAAGLHSHPCPVVGFVASGSIRFQIEGYEVQTLHRGNAFFEPADTRIAMFNNESAVDGAAFIAFYLLSAHQDKVIEMLDA